MVAFALRASSMILMALSPSPRRSGSTGLTIACEADDHPSGNPGLHPGCRNQAMQVTAIGPIGLEWTLGATNSRAGRPGVGYVAGAMDPATGSAAPGAGGAR